MAVGNLIKGTSAGGLASYLLGSHDHNGDERPRADKIGGTIIGDTVKEITQEAEDLHALRPSLGKHIAHMSINFSPEDRQLTDQEQAEIGAFWAEGMGFESYAIFSHGDHEHILASRVKSDGSVVSDSNDWARSEKLIREIEQKWDLVKVEASHLLEPEKGRDHKTTLSMAEIALAEKGEPSARLELQQMLDDLLSEPVTATEFVDHLEAAGVDVRPIKQMSGTSEFNETYFTEAVCDADDIVGGVGDGWKIESRGCENFFNLIFRWFVSIIVVEQQELKNLCQLVFHHLIVAAKVQRREHNFIVQVIEDVRAVQIGADPKIDMR